MLAQEREAGYQHVYTPDLGKVELYKRLGPLGALPRQHVPADAARARRAGADADELPAPHPHLPEQPAQLPRAADPHRARFGTMYRYEKSGVVGGLSRVRAMNLNDAHIFCTPDQIKTEFAGVMRLVERAYATLGITDYSYRLSLRDPADTEKYVQNDEMWELGERVLREAMAGAGPAVLRGAGRGRVLRTEARHPDPRRAGPRGDASRRSRSTSTCRTSSSWSTSARTARATGR